MFQSCRKLHSLYYTIANTFLTLLLVALEAKLCSYKLEILCTNQEEYFFLISMIPMNGVTFTFTFRLFAITSYTVWCLFDGAIAQRVQCYSVLCDVRLHFPQARKFTPPSPLNLQN